MKTIAQLTRAKVIKRRDAAIKRLMMKNTDMTKAELVFAKAEVITLDAVLQDFEDANQALKDGTAY